MQSPPSITFRNLDPSEAIANHVRARCADLGKLHPRIISCDVVIEAPQKRRQTAREFKVHLKVAVSGPDVNVSREFGHGAAAEDVNLAIHEVFEAAGRLLLERKRRLAGHPDDSRSIV